MSQGKDLPKISIITANLNGGETLERTIRSVVSQSYPNKEYILIDGGSTDGSLAIIGKFIKCIDLLVEEQDDGISDAFNKGIERAQGDLIGIISSDDYFADDILPAIANAFIGPDRPGVIYGNAGYVEKESIQFVKPDSLSKFLVRQPLKHSSVFVSRSAYDRHGLFRRDYRFAMDYELLLRLYLSGERFHYLDRTLSFYSSGGIAQENITNTVREVRAISTAYGFPRPYAYFHMYLKLLKLSVKAGLRKLHLEVLLRAHRRISKRYFEEKML